MLMILSIIKPHKYSLILNSNSGAALAQDADSLALSTDTRESLQWTSWQTKKNGWHTAKIRDGGLGMLLCSERHFTSQLEAMHFK